MMNTKLIVAFLWTIILGLSIYGVCTHQEPSWTTTICAELSAMSYAWNFYAKTK